LCYSPSLGEADSFGILSSTYTNTVSGTTINGDLGYTTGPAVAPTVNGTTFITPSQAGTDQAAALAALNAQPVDIEFSSATDLSLIDYYGDGIGVYHPGVYYIVGAASIGTGGITLDGAGTYIFRMTGALNTVADSAVTLSNGASPRDIFWTPVGATTLGANSTFIGTVIDDAGITIGSTVDWTGRALAYNGTVSTDTVNPPAVVETTEDTTEEDTTEATPLDTTITDTTQGEQATTTETDRQIPKTSTPLYNILLAGIVLTLFGAMGWIIARKINGKGKT